MMALLHWFGSLADTVIAWGYMGVYAALVIEGLGLPFPGDAVMAFYGFAASRGDMNVGLVLLCCLLGYMTGAAIAYGVSRRFGAQWLDRVSQTALFSHRSMMRTSGLMDRYGPWLLVPGRFLPGVRSVSSYIAGVSRMDVRSFLLYTVLGACLWCAAWVILGYWFGDHVQVILRTVQSGLAYLTGAMLLVLVAALIYRKKVR